MALGSMDRRAFLSLGRRGRQRLLELSCERLCVRWMDAEAHATRAGAEPESTPETGEPPTRVSAETREELLAELDRRLSGADVLRITDPEWLQGPDLRREVESRIAAFRSTGGRVESDAPTALHRSVVTLWLVASTLIAAPASAQAAPDDVLRARVEAALAAASDVPADSISVQVQGGVVTLSGSVLCADCGGNATPGGVGTVQQSLGAVVRAIPGVTSVRFVLRYRPPR